MPISSLPVSFPKIRCGCLGGLMLFTLTFAFAQTTAPQYFFSHLAGPLGGPGSIDGMGTAARFFNPAGIAVDASGNLYVGDRNNHTIRKISAAGAVTTLAGTVRQPGSADGPGPTAQFAYPYGMAVDRTGNVFVSDRNNHSIRKISPNGVVTTFASQALNYGWADGSGSAAQFAFPDGLAVDAAGNVYVAENRGRGIRKITPDATVTTLVGDPHTGLRSEQTAVGAELYLSGVAVDNAGTIYVADNGNHTIRKVTAGGSVTTLAGLSGQTGSADGIGAAARFYYPQGIAVDQTGNVYVADQFNHTIRKITPGGVVSTLAGTAGRAGSADGAGAAAEFNDPFGLTIDPTGNLFVADWGNHTIRKITPTGVVTTVAGMAGAMGITDDTGTRARFLRPSGVTVDLAGNIYAVDKNDQTIRKISPAGATRTLARFGDPLKPSFYEEVGLSMYIDRQPTGVAVDNLGNVYAIDLGKAPDGRICKITPDGVVTTLVQWSYWDWTGSGNGAKSLSYMTPRGLATDRAGNLYVADAVNNSIRKITPDGTVTTVAGDGTYYKPESTNGTGENANLNVPVGVAVDNAGNVYVADTYNHTIRKIAPGGIMTTIAGTAGQSGSTDGTGAEARFNLPTGVAADNAGNVYVADFYNQAIRKISAGGVVTTIGGTSGGVWTHYDGAVGKFGSADGIGSAAQFCFPSGIAVNSAGQIYVADTENHAIRQGQLAALPVITTQPLGQNAAPGTNVQFSVTASGTPAPTYQWFFNGSVFSGATTNTLSFASARSTDAGDYTVVVTNEYGAVTSAKATLTISSASVTTPSSTPAPAAGGGGSVEGWFSLAFIVLVSTRRWVTRTIRPFNNRTQ